MMDDGGEIKSETPGSHSAVVVAVPIAGGRRPKKNIESFGGVTVGDSPLFGGAAIRDFDLSLSGIS
jgi:hypothetical protein